MGSCLGSKLEKTSAPILNIVGHQSLKLFNTVLCFYTSPTTVFQLFLWIEHQSHNCIVQTSAQFSQGHHQTYSAPAQPTSHSSGENDSGHKEKCCKMFVRNKVIRAQPGTSPASQPPPRSQQREAHVGAPAAQGRQMARRREAAVANLVST